MFSSRNKKNNVYSCKPQFYYIKVGFKGIKFIKACFRDENQKLPKCHVFWVNVPICKYEGTDKKKKKKKKKTTKNKINK